MIPQTRHRHRTDAKPSDGSIASETIVPRTSLSDSGSAVDQLDRDSHEQDREVGDVSTVNALHLHADGNHRGFSFGQRVSGLAVDGKELHIPVFNEKAGANLRHPLSLILLALTFSTGIVDAVSYLGLGHVFTATMTGNVVQGGFGIAHAGGLPVLVPIVSMAAFILGASVSGVLARRLADRHPAHVAYALALEAALLAGAAILAAAAHPHPGTIAGDGTIALMAAAMGIRNATVRRLAVPDLTTTLLTTALTGLAADSIVAGGSGKGSLRRACAILAMLAGALSGALMLRTGLTLPLGFAAALALATGFAYLTVRRRIRVPPRPATSAPRPRSPPTAAGPATAQLSWSPS